MTCKTALSFILCFLFTSAFSQKQDSLNTTSFQNNSQPISIEILVGNKGFAFQLIGTRQFSQKSRFAFLNVTNFTGDYKTTNQTADFFSQSLIAAEICKGISVTTGLIAMGSSATPTTVRPTAGLQYFFANRDFVVIVLPRFDLTPTYNFETFAVLEYKPVISKYWGIYSRLQGLYNYNTQLKFHEVSNICLRLGLSYQNVQAGLGTNLAFFGPSYSTVNNIGVFIKTDLF